MSSSSTRHWLKLRISDIVKKSHSANYHGYNDTHRFVFVANVVINLNERFQKEPMNHFNIRVIDVFKIKYSFISCLLHIKLNQINQYLTLFFLPTDSFIHVYIHCTFRHRERASCYLVWFATEIGFNVLIWNPSSMSRFIWNAFAYIYIFFIEVKGPDSSAYLKYVSQCTYTRQHRYIVATQWVTFVYRDISTYRLQFYSIFLIFYFSFRISGMEYTIVLLKVGMICDKTIKSKHDESIAKHVRYACVIH